MAGQLEARVVITAQDETAKAFNSIKERIAGIDKVVGTLNKAMGAVEPAMKAVSAFKMPSVASAEMSKMVDTIGRVDKVMGSVSRSAGSMAGNIGKTSAEVVQLSSKLMDAGSKLKAIGDFRVSTKGVKEASLAMQKAEQDARSLAVKLDGVPSPARSMIAAHASALTEVRETGRALERQVATASAARTALAELGVPLNRLRTEEEQLKAAVLGTSDALRRQIGIEEQSAAAAQKAAAAHRMSAEEQRRHPGPSAVHGGGHDHGFANYALTSAAMAVSAHEITSVILEAWHEGSELQHERTQLTNAGRTPEEMREIEAAGRKTIRDLPTANFTETMKVVAETTSAFGSVHHAIDNLPFMMKAMEVLKSAGGDKIQGDAGSVGRDFAKTFEERMTRPEDFQKEARQMIPAMVASGGVFNPHELYNFAQQAKSALPNYDMRFLSRIVPSIVGAMGGQRAGTAANAFNSIVMGKVNDKKQAEAWEKFGLLDNTKVLKKAGNVVSWTAGAVKDTNLALQDPLKWAETVALPAMLAKGVKIDDRLELAKELGTMFRNQNGNMFANEMFQEASRSRLHKDEALYNKTGDLDEIYNNDLGEFKVAAGALGESLKTLGAATTAPLMHSVATALSGLAGGFNQLSAFGLEHPTMAGTAGVTAALAALAAAGKVGHMLYTGFGLTGSAAALTSSAGALDAAAARLGAGGGGLGFRPPGGVPVPPVVPLPPLAPAAAIPGAVTLGAAGLAFGGGIFLSEMVRKSFESQQPGRGGLYSAPTVETLPQERQRLADLQTEAEGLRSQIAEAKSREKVPGSADVDNYARQQRLDQLAGPIQELARAIDVLAKLPQQDDRETRARAWARPGDYSPLPPVRPGELPPMSQEEFGPYQPHLLDTDRQERARRSEIDVTSRFHRADDPWMEGDRAGIEERSRRGAAMFRQGHEGAAGRAMMEHFGSLPDLSNIHATVEGPVTATVTGQASINVIVTVNPSGQLLSAVAKAENATVALKSGDGPSRNVGTSYPQTSPAGRMGPR